MWALDLDGVVWRSDAPIDGSVEAVDRLRELGEPILFLTNNSSRTIGENLTKLEGVGISAEPAEVLTSAQAAASLLEPGSSAVLCAGYGVEEALVTQGVEVLRHGPADAVVVGWHADFNVESLARATSAILAGARLIGTNHDAVYPVREGVMPGGGAILAAVAYASGTFPVIAGKPFDAMATLLTERVGSVDILVGDRPDTDGRLAEKIGAQFALVLSGVTASGDLPVTPAPDVVAADLAELVRSSEVTPRSPEGCSVRRRSAR